MEKIRQMRRDRGLDTEEEEEEVEDVVSFCLFYIHNWLKFLSPKIHTYFCVFTRNSFSGQGPIVLLGKADTILESRLSNKKI